MSDKKKLQEFLGYLEGELNAREPDGIDLVAAGLYGDDGHVGDDDEDIVGMIWIEEKLSDTESRVWNVRVKLDD